MKKKVIEIFKKNLPDYVQVGNRFYDNRNSDFTKVVEIQFLKIGANEHAITIYFAIWLPKYFMITSGKKLDPKELGIRNGVLNCNINDIINDFKGRPKIKYWDLTDDDSFLNEIEDIIKNYLIPFSNRINSLNNINEIIESINYPLKEFADVPVMILALKLFLNRDSEFYQMAQGLKSKNLELYGNLVDKLILEFKAKQN